jgi:hypothetical protein
VNGGLATALRDGPGNCCMKSLFEELAHVGVLTTPPSNELFENQADLFSAIYSNIHCLSFPMKVRSSGLSFTRLTSTSFCLKEGQTELFCAFSVFTSKKKTVALVPHPWSKAANAAAGSDIAHAAIGVL